MGSSPEGSLRVLALVPYPRDRAPGQRYRIEQWEPVLAEHGIQLTFEPFLSGRGMEVLHRPGFFLTKILEVLRGHGRRLRFARGVAGFDIVFVYREASLLGPAWLERRASRLSRLVVDFDDAIWLPSSSPANRWVSVLRRRSAKAEALCRACACATVGNDHLAEWAEARAPRVVTVPSTIDTDWYRPRRRVPNPRPVLGWTGSLTTAGHLELLAEPLRQLQERREFELLVIGAEPRLPGVRVRTRPWSALTEVEDLQVLDVGLMPLPDSEWARGKCGMKALQYMGLGIPAVVSPVGANATIVTDGVDGLHARGPSEWIECLEALLRDPQLRQRLGAAARERVERSFSARVQAPRLAEVLRSVRQAVRRDVRGTSGPWFGPRGRRAPRCPGPSSPT